MGGHIICMGTSGSGKSTVGAILAAQAEIPFLDADDLHSEENKVRMAERIALTDADRAPWLARIREWMRTSPDAVVACSALKRDYRDILRDGSKHVVFVHIEPPHDVLRQRMAARTNHFMGADQLDSQLAVLEPLDDSENGFTVRNDRSPQETVAEILARLPS